MALLLSYWKWEYLSWPVGLPSWKNIWTIYFYILQVSDGLYASVKEPPQLYDVPKDQPLIDFGATGGQTYDNKDGQVYDNKGKHILSCFYSVARAYFITFIDGHYILNS